MLLELKNLKKSYSAGNFSQSAIDDISINFNDEGFVSILGPSGCGKTTLLNIVGGLDKPDSGNIFIEGVDTEKFSERKWDSYRNHEIGFIFQNYNLISHLSVFDNVALGLTLSGKNKRDINTKVNKSLKQVGIEEHIHKKPSQLSGGQMQRVAIARALVNNPNIILADEPTGALDSKTSTQVMKILKQISEKRLVIMVTHDEKTAKKYSDRIVRLKDGKVIGDENIRNMHHKKKLRKLSLKNTAMKYTQALKLSFNNIKTKKIRTLITSFAASIGIIGVTLVLAISNGLSSEITSVERSMMNQFPITINQTYSELTTSIGSSGIEEFPDKEALTPYSPGISSSIHNNDIRAELLEYLDQMDEELTNDIVYKNSARMNLITQRFSDDHSLVNQSRVNFGPLLSNQNFFEDEYDVIYGQFPQQMQEIVLVVDEYNRLRERILTTLGFNSSLQEIDFEDIVGKEFKLLLNNDFYTQNSSTSFIPRTDYEQMYNEPGSISIEISGIVRVSRQAQGNILDSGLKHLPELADFFIEDAYSSDIAVAQRDNPSVNVLTGIPIDGDNKDIIYDEALRRIGASKMPAQILIYPKNFEDKSAITEYLENFNTGKDEEDKIFYTDLGAFIGNVIGEFLTTITYVLIFFSSISLLVSSIMIGILMYTSVLERIKEIGILRSLGARKKDISRVFNAEALLIGFASGTIGVSLAFILTFPINSIVGGVINANTNIADLTWVVAISLVIVSMMLTLFSAYVPSKIASNRDPVEALRSE